jgi:putative redox protein
MAKQEVQVKWTEKMAFEAEINGHKIIMDALPEGGGEDTGPRPKPFMLAALGGCTGMDMVSILRKMRVDFEGVNVRVEGNLTEEHPKQFSKMHVIYEFTGNNLPLEKLQKAVDLSEERYCGVSALYKKVIPVTSEIIIIEG